MMSAEGLHGSPGTPQLRLLSKVVQVMEVLTADGRGLVMGEIVKKTGLPMTTVGRIVHNLVALGVLEQEDRRFRVGVVTVAWAASALQGMGMVDHSHEVLRRLRDATGETSFVVVRSGLNRICIAVEESTIPVRHTVDLGYRVPLYVGSTGWVFLAFDQYFAELSLEKMEAYWPEVFSGEFKVVLDEVRIARQKGYAISINSSGIGASGISVPVLDGNDGMVAAMGITGPHQRVTAEMIKDELRPLVLEGATELSRRLGLMSGRHRITHERKEK